MKLFLALIIVMGALSGLIKYGIDESPGYVYSKIINEQMSSKWYSLNYPPDNYLKANMSSTLEMSKSINEDFWQVFHIGSLLIPLPIKNPFFFVAPIMEYSKKLHKTNLGISIYDAKKEVLAQIHFLENVKFPNYLHTQELFKLPLVRQYLEKKTSDEIWNDLFTFSIPRMESDMYKAFYNLYILNFRQSFLPETKITFRKIQKSDLFIVELKTDNKDFLLELVLRKKANTIFSFLIKTARGNVDSETIRYKFLKDIDYQFSTPSLGKILFREFQALPYRDQIDHTGMLYLLSSWSHEDTKIDMLKTMVRNLERGSDNIKQLEPLYRYMVARYNSIYATVKLKGLDLRGDVLLKRNIEVERLRLEREELRASLLVMPAPDKKNEFDELIEKAKRSKKKDLKSISLD